MNIFDDILEFIAPRVCPCCGKRLGAMEEYVCVNCYMFMPRTNYHLLKHNDNEVEKLFWKKVPIENVVDLVYYEKDTQGIVHKFKYRNSPYLAWYIMRCLVKEIVDYGNSNNLADSDSAGGIDLFSDVDAIIPVPLHWFRFSTRGYNQSYYLAKGIEDVVHIPIWDDVVCRRRYNLSQTKFQRHQRAANVKDIFRLTKPEKVADKHVLLVDDVMTSGSTIMNLAQEVAKAPGVRISILCFAHAKSR